MDRNSRLKFEEWARYAEEDVTVAKTVLKEKGPPNQICFHAQQAAEKYLKGYLVLNEHPFEKVHQLRYLLELCVKLDPSFEELKEEAFYLTRFYIETRYPGDIPEFNVDQAKKAIESALLIRKFVLTKIEP